jgi:hypothetical protein
VRVTTSGVVQLSKQNMGLTVNMGYILALKTVFDVIGSLANGSK